MVDLVGVTPLKREMSDATSKYVKMRPTALTNDSLGGASPAAE